MHLLVRQMGQQVADAVGHIFIVNIHHTAVFFDDHTFQSKRNGSPLIFFDTAVIVGSEMYQTLLLGNGIGLEVQTGRVDMGGGNVDTLFHILFAHHGKGNGFGAVDHIHFVACLVGLACFISGKTVFFCLFDKKVHTSALSGGIF